MMELFNDDERDELGPHFEAFCQAVHDALKAQDERTQLTRNVRVKAALAALEAVKATLILSHSLLNGRDVALALEEQCAGEYKRLRGEL